MMMLHLSPYARKCAATTYAFVVRTTKAVCIFFCGGGEGGSKHSPLREQFFFESCRRSLLQSAEKNVSRFLSLLHCVCDATLSLLRNEWLQKITEECHGLVCPPPFPDRLSFRAVPSASTTTTDFAVGDSGMIYHALTHSRERKRTHTLALSQHLSKPPLLFFFSWRCPATREEPFGPKRGIAFLA